MQKLTVKAKGLATFPNQISEVPVGSLAQADNVIIDREGVLEPRRGFNTVPGQLGTNPSNRANQLFRFGNNVISHYGLLNSPNKLAFYAPKITITGTQTSGSPIITAVSSLVGLYIGQNIQVPIIEQAFTGQITQGSNLLTNVFSNTGLYIGQSVGSIGIPANATISLISGTGPYTVTMSAVATYSDSNAAFTASNINLLSFPSGTKITNIGTTTVTLSNPATLNGPVTLNCYGWIDFSNNYLKPSLNAKIRSVEANNNVYFTSFEGVQKLDSVNNPIVLSGAPAGLDGSAILDSNSSGFMPDNVQVAYRVVWGYKDANKNLILGAPSQRIEISNTTGMSKNVNLNITIPTEITINHFYQLYRSGFSATANDIANDEMILVYEANPITANLTAGFITILDETPESLRNGPALYTSPSQEGILQANTPPPFCQDLALFKGSVFFANTKTKQNQTLNILSVSSKFSFFANTTNVNANTPTTIRNINYSVTGNVLTNSNIISNISDTSSLAIGQTIYNATHISYFADNTVITNILSSTSILVSNPSIGTATGDTIAVIVNGITLGQIITGTGIQANATVTQVYIPITLTGNVAHGSPIITNIPSTLTLGIGQPVTGPGIPTNTTVQSIDSNTQVTLSKNVNLQVTGNLNSTTTITGIVDASFLVVNQSIIDITTPGNIPPNTVITSITGTGPYTITISNAATNTVIGNILQVGASISPFSITGSLVSGTNILSNITNTSGFILASGQTVSDNTNPTFLPSETVISAVSPSVQLSNNALSSATINTFTIAPNLPDLIFGEGIQISKPATIVGTNVTLTVQNGASGIQVNDTITIAGTVYTAKLIENIATKQFKVYAQGSPAQNIADTAKSLIRVMNRTTGPIPSTYAFYLSGFNDLPGKIYFEERVFGGGTFSITASSTLAGKAYSPNLPATGTLVSSQNDEFANGLYYSKTQQPEAVPILNFVKVGSAHAAISRIIALRDSLIILKEDGIYRLTGSSPISFQVDLFDATTQILSAESAVALNNLIFMFSKYGIVTVSDTGVEVISRIIEDKMLDLFEVSLNKAKLLSFGISYESDRKYIFHCITNSDDEYATQAYVYNTFTKTWTRWVLNQTCGIIHPSEDLIYLGDAVSNAVDQERKTRNYTDYTDSSFAITLLPITGTTTNGSSIITSISNTVGFSIGQQVSGLGIPLNALIIDTTNSTITLNKVCTSNGITTLLPDAGKTISVDNSTSILNDVEVGDVFYQTDSRYSIITAVDKIHNTITVKDFIDNWVYGPSFIYKAFQSTVTYVPQTAQNPGAIKQFREAALLLQVPFFNQIQLSFSTDLSPGNDTISLNGVYGQLWGRSRWGSTPWGGTMKPTPIRTYVPQQKQRCSFINVTLSHREAYAFYRLNGITFTHNSTSERVSK